MTFYLIESTEDGPDLRYKGDNFYKVMDSFMEDREEYIDPSVTFLSDWPDDWAYVPEGHVLLIQGEFVVPETIAVATKYKLPDR